MAPLFAARGFGRPDPLRGALAPHATLPPTHRPTSCRAGVLLPVRGKSVRRTSASALQASGQRASDAPGASARRAPPPSSCPLGRVGSSQCSVAGPVLARRMPGWNAIQCPVAGSVLARPVGGLARNRTTSCRAGLRSPVRGTSVRRTSASALQDSGQRASAAPGASARRAPPRSSCPAERLLSNPCPVGGTVLVRPVEGRFQTGAVMEAGCSSARWKVDFKAVLSWGHGARSPGGRGAHAGGGMKARCSHARWKGFASP